MIQTVKKLDTIEFYDALAILYEADESKADKHRLLQLAAERMIKAVKVGPVHEVMIQIASIFKVFSEKFS